MEKEKIASASSGYSGIILFFITVGLGIGGIILFNQVVPLLILSLVLILVALFSMLGLVVVNPNESVVMTLFGAYKGTLKENGFFWINPFYHRKKISLRARNLNRDPIKVNDKLGNPIMIGIVLVWKVEETFRAAFTTHLTERKFSVCIKQIGLIHIKQFCYA